MIGFTSRTFAAAIAKGELSLRDAVAWAVAERFPWLELRDGALELSDGEIEELRALASRGGVRLHFAWDGTNLLDPEDRSRFEKGLRSAGLLGPGTYVRVTIAGRAIRDSAAKRGYSAGEVARLKDGIERSVRLAEERGLRLVFENSHEPLAAPGGAEAGMRELLAAVANLELAFDPGNFMDRLHNRAPCSGPEVSAFYRENSGRIPYVHVKMTKDGIVQPWLIPDGDVGPAFYRGMIQDGKLVCIELPEAEDADSCKRRILDARRMLEEPPGA